MKKESSMKIGSKLHEFKNGNDLYTSMTQWS